MTGRAWIQQKQWRFTSKQKRVHLTCKQTDKVCQMTMITIPLSDERLAQWRVMADQAGLPADEFLRRRVEQLLDRPDDAFDEAATFVLEKNAELYRRLA